MAGKISKREETALLKQVARQPQNPLFLHAVGKDLEAIEILKKEHLWPSGRLPRRSDRKEEWLPMRDYGNDWKPVVKSLDLVPHHGGDFLFCWWLIKNKYQIKSKS